MTKILWTTVLLCLSLLTAELFFRIEPKLRKKTGVGTSEQSRFLSTPTEFVPYVDGFNVKNWVSQNLNTNSFGFRTSRELSTTKSANEKRIFVLGGSAAIGWGATSDETTFALQLERRLQEKEQETYVFNAGCDGYNSNQEWVLMATKIMDLKPDLIVLFDGYNDLYYSMSRQWTPEYNIYSAQILHQISFHPWYLHSALLRTIDAKTKLSRLRRSQVGYSGIFRPEYFDVYSKNLRKIQWAAARERAQVLVVLQPHFLIAERDLPTHEKKIFDDGHDVNMYPNYSDLIRKLYTVAREGLRKADVLEPWTFADANDWFKGNPNHLFLDEVHLTDAGHTIVASELASILIASGWLGHSTRSVAQRLPQ